MDGDRFEQISGETEPRVECCAAWSAVAFDIARTGTRSACTAVRAIADRIIKLRSAVE